MSDHEDEFRKAMEKVLETHRSTFEKLARIESLENKISCLEMLKPREKRVVIKETVVRKETPKIVYIGLGVSIALNILVLILK